MEVVVMNDKELRRQLKSLGYSAGPITDSTRSLYVKKFNRLRSERQQRERSSRKSRAIGQKKEADVSAAALSRQARPRPSAASADARFSSVTSGAWSSRVDQDDDETTAEPEADNPGSLADDFADGQHTEKWESVGGGRYSDPHRGTTSSNLYSEISSRSSYVSAFDSLSSERCTSNDQYSDPCTMIFDSLNSYETDRLRSDQYPTKTDGLNSDQCVGETDSLLTDRYAGKTGNTFSDRYAGKTDSLLTDRYAGKSGSTFSDRYAGKTDSLLTDRYAGKTGNTFSDRYAGKTDSLLTDRYAGKTGSTFSDRYAGKTDSLLTNRYAGKTGSTFSDRYAGKTDNPPSDQLAEKTDSLYSRRYTGITDSVNVDSCTGKYQGTSSDPYAGKFSDNNTKKVQGLYSDTHYRGWPDSWSENDDDDGSQIHRTSGSAKKENQKHKNRLVKFEFYLSRFLYISTIVLCLVLLALVCVKGLGLVESQEDIDENIKMLPMDCHGKTDTFCRAEEHKMIMIILTEMYEYLAEIAGEFECGSESTLKSKCVPVIEAKTHLSMLNVPNINKFNEALQWIMQCPRDLGIRLVGEDSEATITSVDQVTCLESTHPHMNLYCRLQRAFFTILNRMFIFITVLSLLWITLLLLKYYSRKMKEQQHDMYEMVNKIIAAIRDHNQEWEKDLELVPYVPIPHVRDTLIQPKDRKKMKKIWQKAVQFLEANESRIRTEKQRINGQDFLVWRWTQPSSLCDTM